MCFADWWKLWEAARYGKPFECIECTDAAEANFVMQLFRRILGKGDAKEKR